MCILIRKAVAIRKERTCATGLIPAFPTPSAFSMQEHSLSTYYVPGTVPGTGIHREQKP